MRWLFFALALLTPAVAQAQTRWEYNGWTFGLFSNGTIREFRYEKAGIFHPAGKVLFSGKRSGNNYQGTIHDFSLKCGPVPYAVAGTVAEDQRSVTLRGRKPILEKGCKARDYKDDVLVFNFIDPKDSLPKQDLAAETSRSGLGNEIVCILPIPKALKNLSDLARERSEVREAAEANMRHLLERFCREVDEHPSADQYGNEQLTDKCWQQSGTLNGEKVYWTACLAEGEGD
jgi:hypothetical protein